MRICDLHTGAMRLTRSAKALREQWGETSEYWKDKNHDDFDAKHIQPLAPEVTLMLAAIHRLADVLAQAERELTDEERQV
jgi:hypothetical protein